MNFQVGDEVSWCGLMGRVTDTSDADQKCFPVKVLFSDCIEDFTSDGKYRLGQEPSLKLIRRKERQRFFRTYYQRIYKNAASTHLASELFDSVKEATDPEWESCTIGYKEIVVEVWE